MVSIDHFLIEIIHFYQYKYLHYQIDTLVFLQMFDYLWDKIRDCVQLLSFQQDL